MTLTCGRCHEAPCAARSLCGVCLENDLLGTEAERDRLRAQVEEKQTEASAARDTVSQQAMLLNQGQLTIAALRAQVVEQEERVQKLRDEGFACYAVIGELHSQIGVKEGAATLMSATIAEQARRIANLRESCEIRGVALERSEAAERQLEHRNAQLEQALREARREAEADGNWPLVDRIDAALKEQAAPGERLRIAEHARTASLEDVLREARGALACPRVRYNDLGNTHPEVEDALAAIDDTLAGAAPGEGE